MATPNVLSTVTTGVTNTGGENAPFNSVSHTTDTGTTLLIVFVHYGYKASDRHATIVRFDGTNLTELGTVVNTTDARVDLWYLKAPAITTGVITITSWGGGTARLGFTAINIKDNDATATFGTLATATAHDTAPQVSATSTAGELVIAGLAFKLSSATLTEGTGITEHSQFDHVDSIGGEYATGTKAGETSTLMDWSSSLNDDWAIAAVAIKPVATGDDHIVVPNDALHGHAAANVTVFEEGAAPAAPTAAAVDSFLSNSITGSFTDNTGGTAQHRAYFKLTADTEWTLSATLDVGDTVHIFLGLVVGTSYDIGFTSFGDGGESPMTTITQVTTGALLVDEATHSHAADNVTLIADTNHVLLIFPAVHAQFAGVVTLSGTGLLHIGGSHV